MRGGILLRLRHISCLVMINFLLPRNSITSPIHNIVISLPSGIQRLSLLTPFIRGSGLILVPDAFRVLSGVAGVVGWISAVGVVLIGVFG